MYDVIIVGAGPAGAFAAYNLAKASARVLLLEKRKLPRFKPCGGGISSKFLSSLPFDVSGVVTGKISRARFYYDMADPCEVELDVQMAMLNRMKFDDLIAKEATGAGARLMDEVLINELDVSENKIAVLTDKGKFEARYLIGADGVHSFVRRRVNLLKNRKIWGSIEVELPGLRHDMDTIFFNFGQLREGYAWSFPKSDYFSVGIGGKRGRLLWIEFRKWLDFLDCRNQDELKIYSHPLPYVVPGEKLQNGTVLLVGDAAGMVDPLTGEGIRYAIRSAQIASSVILKEKIDEYSLRVFKEISSDFKYAYRLKWFFVHWPKFCYRFGVKNPVVSRSILRICSGNLNYREFVSKVFHPTKLFRKV